MRKNLFLRVIAMLIVVIMMGTMIVACNGDTPADQGNTPSTNNGGNSGNNGGNSGNNGGSTGNNGGSSGNNGGSTGNNGGNTGNGGSDTPVDEPVEEVTVDMDGYEFTALARQTSWFANEVTAEPDTGDQILQAVYDRNWAVEEKYNCIMTQAFIGENEWTTWQTSVKAGDNAYKYSLNHMMQTASESLNGTMLNLKLLPNVNLEADYWNQSMNKELTIANKLYFTANEFCTSSVYFTWLMIFNMEMCAERNIDVYGMIEDGTWTIDALYDIVSSSYEDNGNGTVDFVEDTFGLTSHNNTVLTNYIFAFNIPVVHLDAAGKVVVDFNDANTPMVTAVEKVYDLFYNSSNGGILMTNERNTYGLLHDEALCTKFSTGTTLFSNTRLLGLEILRTSDVKYGIIPFPKYNEEQEGYYSHIDGRGSLLFVPYTLPENEYEYVGLLLDNLAKMTKEDVMPVIQNAALIGRYSEDSDAYKCLEMTLNGRTYAFAYVFNSVLKTSQPYWSMPNIIANGASSFTDYWKSKSRTAEREINSAFQSYAKANK